MKSERLIRIALCGYSFFAFAGCSQMHRKTVNPERAEEIGIKVFSENGFSASNYVVRVLTDRSGSNWLIRFEPKAEATFGSKHSVRISKSTGKAVFQKGQ